MKKYWGLASSAHVGPGRASSAHVSPAHANSVHANSVQTHIFATHLRQLYRRFVHDEKGSAIVEFVVLAIPLFIPIFIYLASFASLSGNEAIVRTLAREALRAYVASENDHAGREVSAQALAVIAEHLGLTDTEIRTLSARYECSENPCLSANGRIRLTISYIDSRSHRTIEASAQEHISPWM